MLREGRICCQVSHWRAAYDDRRLLLDQFFWGKLRLTLGLGRGVVGFSEICC